MTIRTLELAVLPTAQRCGVGTAFLDIARGAYSSLNAWTFQRNSAARNFYESRGLTKIKETRRCRKSGERTGPPVFLVTPFVSYAI
jgi:GNAT superfamily N-acetyltransferase